MTKIQMPPAGLGAASAHLRLPAPTDSVGPLRELDGDLVVPESLSKTEANSEHLGKLLTDNARLLRNWDNRSAPLSTHKSAIENAIKAEICPAAPADAVLEVAQTFTKDGRPILQMEITDRQLNRYGLIKFDAHARELVELRTEKDYQLPNRLETALEKFVVANSAAVEQYNSVGPDGLPCLNQQAVELRDGLKSVLGLPKDTEIAVTSLTWRTRAEGHTQAVVQVSAAGEQLIELRGVIGKRLRADISPKLANMLSEGKGE